MDPDTERAVRAGFDDSEQPDSEAKPPGRLEVLQVESGDPLPVNVASHHFGAEGDVGQDGCLGGSIETLDIGRRVPFAYPRLCASDSASW